MSRLYERLLFVLAIALGAAYLYFLPEPAPTGAHIAAQPAPEIAREETVPQQVDVPVQVHKPAAKKKLKLPAEIQQAPTKHVVASTLTANDERQHTVTTVLDTGTGQFTTFDRVEPRPWIAPRASTEVGVFYGLSGGERAVLVNARREFLQIKALRVGVTADAVLSGGTADAFVGVGAWARW